MAIPTILSRGGTTVYPVTIPQAIIDPETGEPANLGSDMEYTINNTHADENGNFTITSELVGAAPTSHQHAISDVTDLQTTLNGKSATNHTHTMVTGISVGGSVLTGSAQVKGTGNVKVTQSGSDINITITPYTTDTSDRITDSNSENVLPVRIFTGTQEEWDTFKSSMQNNSRYIVFIRS
jgi:hypothetical protein